MGGRWGLGDGAGTETLSSESAYRSYELACSATACAYEPRGNGAPAPAERQRGDWRQPSPKLLERQKGPPMEVDAEQPSPRDCHTVKSGWVRLEDRQAAGATVAPLLLQ